MITGFTIGHSVTPSLSVLGLLSVVSTAVEALIGFTVALLAVEVFARAPMEGILPPGCWRWWWRQ
ncbi:MAG: HupE/UreJ family protein [Gammaproteobacteria bacterium]|nr:HupE/UreJ family protein [Gammaproteobacteria bacterium]